MALERSSSRAAIYVKLNVSVFESATSDHSSLPSRVSLPHIVSLTHIMPSPSHILASPTSQRPSPSSPAPAPPHPAEQTEARCPRSPFDACASRLRKQRPAAAAAPPCCQRRSRRPRRWARGSRPHPPPRRSAPRGSRPPEMRLGLGVSTHTASACGAGRWGGARLLP